MKPGRLVFLTILLAGVTSLLYIATAGKLRTPLKRTFAPLFTLMGRPVQTADRLLGRMVPVDSVDEKMMGEALRARLQGSTIDRYPDKTYLNILIKDITKPLKTEFEYEVFLISGPPNAAALPGGVVLVTTGLMDAVKTEGQLVAILSHEVGHIERKHCFEHFRAEMLGKKMGMQSLGKLADFLYSLGVRIHFSKTQEEEADRFGFELLTTLTYHPNEMSRAFEILKGSERSTHQRQADVFRDYLDSHPPIDLRIENYRELAKRRVNADPKPYYIGAQNLETRTARSQFEYPMEFQ